MIILSGLALLFFVIVIFTIGALPKDEGITYSKQLLPFTTDSIFIKTRIWGNENIAVITKSPKAKFIPDSTLEYIIDLRSSVFYKCVNDSLILFVAHKLTRPRFFNSKIIVKEVVLDNPAMMDLISGKKYLELKLKKIE